MSVHLNKGDVSGGINMTPMIDCVFLLLIFFLIATRLEEERELSVLLPQASEAMPLTARPKELFVNVTQEGHFVVGNERLDEAGLLQALRQAWANNPGRQKVIIRADRRCVWEYVVAVMNLCNKANIRDYTVSTLDSSS